MNAPFIIYYYMALFFFFLEIFGCPVNKDYRSLTAVQVDVRNSALEKRQIVIHKRTGARFFAAFSRMSSIKVVSSNEPRLLNIAFP